MQRLKLFVLTVVTALSLGAVALTAPAYAATSKDSACAALNQLDSSQGCGSNADSAVHGLVGSIVNILSILVGVAAVIMIIVAGFKYITSGGDSSAISGAKNTLVYALVGLAVALLAQFLVHFVLTNV